MSIALIILFCLCPLFGFILSIFLYFYDKNKNGIIYSLIIGISFGILAYHFIPVQTYDLVRHHNIVIKFMYLPAEKVLTYLKILNLEFLPKIYSLLIAYTKNADLLQFFVISTGYTILFSMLQDYRKKSKINTLYFIITVCITIFGFHVLYFFSGLYCYIAYIFFSLGLYLEYEKKSKKGICYVLYAIALLSHNSVFFPFFLLVIYKLFNNKINVKLLIMGIIMFFSMNFLIEIIHKSFNINLINQIYEMFNAYTVRNQLFIKFYSGYVYLIEMLKVIFISAIIYSLRKRKQINSGIYGYIIFLIVMTLMMMTKARVSIRYIMIIQFISIIPIMDYFSCNKKGKIVIIICSIFISVIFGGYFFHLLSGMNFGNFFTEQFYKSIFSIMR